MTQHHITIGDRRIGPGEPCYVVAELSANHNQDPARAEEMIHAAADAGVDAVKLQTYTADTLTIDCDAPPFCIKGGLLWDGMTLHELYRQAYTPWEWQPRLKEIADDRGITLFSTPFDATSVDFLDQLNVPAHKIASAELVDHELLKKIAASGKPIIASTGMADFDEIAEAVDVLRGAGCRGLALLRCVAAYPAKAEQMNLAVMQHLAESFGVVVGLSDHTLDHISSITAVALGASIIEKHFTLSRADGGPDAAFSLEPDELSELVKNVRTARAAVGHVSYEFDEAQRATMAYRRSLFIVKDLAAGDIFTAEHIRSIRPADGLTPKHLHDVLGRHAACDLKRGTPLQWDYIQS